MSVPTGYMTSTKRLPEIFEAIKGAQAPEKFSTRFLERLEFRSKGDRLVISVLKALGFLDEAGRPTQRYYDYLDESQSGAVLADGVREAYADLFAVNVNAHELDRHQVVGKLKTLTQGQYKQGVLGHMASTFTALVEIADFTKKKRPPKSPAVTPPAKEPTPASPPTPVPAEKAPGPGKIAGLVYNLEIILPESRDSAVYDAIFKSLKEHLL